MNRDKEILKKLEQDQWKDEAIIHREREAAVSSMNLSSFVSAIGPLFIVLLKAVNKLPVGPVMGYIIIATAPLGLLLTVINWARTPGDYRMSKLITRAALLSLGAAIGTFVLAGYWGLIKEGGEPPSP